MELHLDLKSVKTNKKKELLSFLKEENLHDTTIKDIFKNGEESDMGFMYESIIQVLIASAPLTAVIVGVLNCIKAYIEVNPKDKVKIKIRGIEIEMSNKNHIEIESTLNKILEIEEKYSDI